MQGMRIKQVEYKTGLKKTKIYQLIHRGLFPSPIKIGSASVWIEAEINEALIQLAQLRNQAVSTASKKIKKAVRDEEVLSLARTGKKMDVAVRSEGGTKR